jgi:hypothetical protein
MTEVDRYGFRSKHHGTEVVVKSHEGKWVRASDYDALTAERDALAQKRNDAERVAGVLTLGNEALQADNARLREALETCLTTMERADFADGWCCCGDAMLNHSSPMDCGHAPVDIAEYHASLAIKNARAALNGEETE